MSIEKYVNSALNAREAAAKHLKNNATYLAEQGIRRNGVTNPTDLKRRKPEVAAELRKRLGI